MILLGNLLIAVGVIIDWIIGFYIIVIVAAVILSWVNPNPQYPFIRMLIQFAYSATEPLFSKIRSKIPPLGMLDLSPFIVIIVLIFLRIVLAGSLMEYGQEIKVSGKESGVVTVGF